jgi:TfoX/Sxy family transcriptional regulator of competence genes
MFGGLAVLLNGNMFVGVWQTSLIARVGPDAYQEAISKPHAKEFDVTGRPMTGWIMVDPEGVDSDDQLKDWIEQAWKFVSKLPAK